MGIYNKAAAIVDYYNRKVRGEERGFTGLLASKFGLGHDHSGLLVDLEVSDDEDSRLQALHLMETKTVVELASELEIGAGDLVLDAGSGWGGSSILISQLFNCMVQGVTISPEECHVATEAARMHGVDEGVRFIHDDVVKYCASNKVDAIWACEVTEHFSDLYRLFRAFRGALRPGGRLVLVAWCAGSGVPAVEVKGLFDELHKTDIHAPAAYGAVSRSMGFVEVGTLDLTDATLPYWKVRGHSENKTGFERLVVDAIERPEPLLVYQARVLQAPEAR